MNVETEITPPDIDEDDDGDMISGRLSLHWLDVGEADHNAAVQFFGDSATDPQKFADALLQASLALASLVGSDHSWAVMQRFAAYDGMPS